MGGKITLITGPILSGKTAELLRHVQLGETQSLSTIIVRHTSDNDPKNLNVAKSLGLKTKTVHCERLGELSIKLYIVHSQVIFIDKGELFDDLAEFCCYHADKRKQIFVAGLKCSPTRTYYKPIIDLFPHCDEIIWLNSMCQSCLNKASFYTRCIKFDENSQYVETYKTQCRACLRR